MEFQLSYLKIMLWKCYTQYASKFGKLRGGHRTGKAQFSFQLQRAMPKTFQTYIQLCSFHILARLCSKSFKLGFSSTWIENFQMDKLDLEKAEERKKERKVKLLSGVWLFASPRTVAYQVPPSMRFSRQEYCSGLPFPSLGDFPNKILNLGLLHCRQMLYHLSRNQRSNCQHPLDSRKSSRKTSTSASLTMGKPLTVWITKNCGKFLRRWEYQNTTFLLRNLYASQEATVKTWHGTTDWFKIGKGVQKGCILSPCLFNLSANTSCEIPGWMNHKLKSRFLGEISTTSDIQMIPL